MNSAADNAETANNRRRCPLCGADNQCTGVLSSNPHQQCWCTTVQIAPETLARISKDRSGVCICPKCVQDPQHRGSEAAEGLGN